MTISKIEIATYLADSALKGLLESMEQSAATLDRAAQEMRRYAANAKAAGEQEKAGTKVSANPTNYATWAISHAVSYPGSNMRLDLIAKYAADYAVAKALAEPAID